MKPIDILFSETRGIDREDYVVEQGVPVLPMSAGDVTRLGVFDESGSVVPANIQVEGKDQNDDVRWVLVSMPVTVKAGGQRNFTLREYSGGPVGRRLRLTIASNVQRVVQTDYFTVEFDDPGNIRLTTADGTILDGPVDFELRSDARSAVGNLRPVYFEPGGYEVIERSEKRVRVRLRGRYRAWTPKAFTYDPVQRYDVDVEFTVYADSPVIRIRWCITDHMRFNCPFMWLDRYVLRLPLVEGIGLVEGDEVPGEGKFASWATVHTPGGRLSMTFPFSAWIGKGAGIELKDNKLGQGGINPPPDGGFGGKSPDLWRKFYYGMSRTFEGSLIVNATPSQVQSELNHLPLILPPEHYSECGELPESGSRVTFGQWKDVVDRAAAWMLDNQWKGTLWFGEFWREIDVDHNLGVEETHSGNTALGPLYHFYRTGDWRFWESAKMAYLYTFDIQFCKQETGDGPYMRTRRFVMDHQEWFHPRYQRVGGLIRGSHLFGDRYVRDKVLWFLRLWGENYVDDDGAPLTPNSDGTKSRCTESAMSNVADSMMYGYIETKDEFFLNKAKAIGDWIVRGAEADLDGFCGNSNSTRYILRGLLQLCKVTDDSKYRDAFVKIAEWTVNAPTFDFGTHYVAFHFYYACQAYKWSGRREILDGILRLAEWVLSKESKESPGTYPFVQRNQYPPARWICSYDNKAIAAYLPVLASTLAEANKRD